MRETPFLEERHHELALRARAIGDEHLAPIEHREDGVDDLFREILRRLGDAGLTRFAVPAAYGGVHESIDVRSICTIREQLAWRMGLADFAFAMQGLGSHPIALAGSEEQKARILPGVARGETVTAFALTEPEAGSDAGALSCSARRVGDEWVISGQKRFISNATIFGAMTLFARTGEGSRGVSAFLVEAGTPGVRVVPQDTMAPHPLGEVIFEDARLPKEALLGEEGSGFKLALATLDLFRSTVGAAALGMAQRAQDEAVRHVRSRKQFGGPLAGLQGVQFLLADNEAELEAARLLVYQAAWTKDRGAARITREAALAKLVATENAQRIIDRSLQLHGGLGVIRGTAVERLYREIRALRIYEGASEVQKVVIARERLKEE
ncbi:acyl-CoA dehydrogenase family protein [Vulgatibacter incomptus]|uniref:Butyryl-CoA dehydrogenase n=1 Tax=Vulgatibacter incomptus TaxID=1391653 RepID=A0A0K1PFH0_9BACT|nr:acyl-CoA dehydrogenase family protein [Vulgatibacter incomptus]AKU92247.1 Butyryl-CoA dehydrogenase [Vulgatibacter incomptus]